MKLATQYTNYSGTGMASQSSFNSRNYSADNGNYYRMSTTGLVANGATLLTKASSPSFPLSSQIPAPSLVNIVSEVFALNSNYAISVGGKVFTVVTGLNNGFVCGGWSRTGSIPGVYTMAGVVPPLNIPDFSPKLFPYAGRTG